MNQEKIGKFIAMLRKEKNMTQNMLAKKLSVTDRAISRWETGRGLPDPMYYQKLCEVLDISLTELFNAERCSINDNQKSDKAISNLLTYLKNKIIKTEHTLKIISIIMVIIIFFLVSVTYRFINLYLYSKTPFSYQTSELNMINNAENLRIEPNTFTKYEYLNWQDIKVKNIFANFNVVKETEDNIIYALTTKENIYNAGTYTVNDDGSYTYNVASLMIGKIDTNDTLIKNFINNNDFINHANEGFLNYKEYWQSSINKFLYKNVDNKKFREKIIQNEKITNDLEFLNYFKKICESQNNFFTKIKDMRKDYVIKKYFSNYLFDIQKISFISGKYDGYLKNDNNIKIITLYKDNKTYYLTFMSNSNYFNEMDILDLLNTIEID